MKLDKDQRWVIINALYVAAERYEEDAAAAKREIPFCARGQGAGLARTAKYFEDLACESRKLAEKLEQAEPL